MDIKELSKIARKLPWDAIAGKLPSKKCKEEFEAIKVDFKHLLKLLETGPLDADVQHKIDAIADRFRAISKDMNTNIGAGAELYSRARLNEITIWNMCDYAERALYLAGRASVDKSVKEPYRTQIVNQASHACLTRYRQAYKIKEYLFKRLEGGVDAEVEFTVNQLSISLLNQLVYFSDLAYVSNPDHALSAYHKALANLIVGHERTLVGRMKEANHHAQLAMGVINKIKTPQPGMHYMQRQYHISNHTEFLTFKRLSQQHDKLCERLHFLRTSAEDLDEASVTTPKDHFNVDWVVGTGQRAASVAGIVIALYAVSDIDMGTVKTAIGQLWHGVVDLILAQDPGAAQDVQRGANVIAANTGGLASLGNTGGLATLTADTGGLATKLAMLA